MQLKAQWIVVALLSLSNHAHSESKYTEVDIVPPEQITKAWRAEVTLSGTLPGYSISGGTSVTLIDGFTSSAECQKQAHLISQTLMSAAKSANGGSWDGHGPSVRFGCHEQDMFMQ